MQADPRQSQATAADYFKKELGGYQRLFVVIATKRLRRQTAHRDLTKLLT